MIQPLSNRQAARTVLQGLGPRIRMKSIIRRHGQDTPTTGHFWLAEPRSFLAISHSPGSWLLCSLL